jgi:hypothetical protein
MARDCVCSRKTLVTRRGAGSLSNMQLTIQRIGHSLGFPKRRIDMLKIARWICVVPAAMITLLAIGQFIRGFGPYSWDETYVILLVCPFVAIVTGAMVAPSHPVQTGAVLGALLGIFIFIVQVSALFKNTLHWASAAAALVLAALGIYAGIRVCRAMAPV